MGIKRLLIVDAVSKLAPKIIAIFFTFPVKVQVCDLFLVAHLHSIAK